MPPIFHNLKFSYFSVCLLFLSPTVMTDRAFSHPLSLPLVHSIISSSCFLFVLTETLLFSFIHPLLSLHHPLISTVSLSYSFRLTLLHWQALLSLLFLHFSSLSSDSIHSHTDRHLPFLFHPFYKDSFLVFFPSFQLEMAEFLLFLSINFFTSAK